MSDFGVTLIGCECCVGRESIPSSGPGLVSANASVTKPRYTLYIGELDGTKSEFAAAITNTIVCR